MPRPSTPSPSRSSRDPRPREARAGRWRATTGAPRAASSPVTPSRPAERTGRARGPPSRRRGRRRRPELAGRPRPLAGPCDEDELCDRGGGPRCARARPGPPPGCSRPEDQEARGDGGPPTSSKRSPGGLRTRDRCGSRRGGRRRAGRRRPPGRPGRGPRDLRPPRRRGGRPGGRPTPGRGIAAGPPGRRVPRHGRGAGRPRTRHQRAVRPWPCASPPGAARGPGPPDSAGAACPGASYSGGSSGAGRHRDGRRGGGDPGVQLRHRRLAWRCAWWWSPSRPARLRRLRRAGYHPATLLGLVARSRSWSGPTTRASRPTAHGGPVHGVDPVWYLLGVDAARPVAGTAATILVFRLGLAARGLCRPPPLDRPTSPLAPAWPSSSAPSSPPSPTTSGPCHRRRHGSPSPGPVGQPQQDLGGPRGTALDPAILAVSSCSWIHPWSPASGGLLGLVVSVVARWGPVGIAAQAGPRA